MKALAARHPLREVLQGHWWPVLLGVGGLAATAGFNGLFFAHMPAYLSGVLGYEPRQAVLAQTVGVLVHAIAILGIGWLGDRLSPRAMFVTGAAALALLAFPFYDALASRALHPVWALALAGLCASLVNGTFAVILTDLFPTRVRFSGVALGFNVAFTIFSGTAPLVATSLIRETGINTAPAFVMVGCALITLAAAIGLAPRGGHVLSVQDARPPVAGLSSPSL
jgi:MFS family permease